MALFEQPHGGDLAESLFFEHGRFAKPITGKIAIPLYQAALTIQE